MALLSLAAMLAGTAQAAVPEGSPFPDTPYLHHSSIAVKKKAEPSYPEGVTEEDRSTRHRCIVWVQVGPKGEVAAARVVPEFAGAGCSAPYQQAAQASLTGWKFKPTKVDGEKSTVHTQIAVVFTARQSAPVVDVSLEGSPPPEPVPQPKRPQAGKPIEE